MINTELLNAHARDATATERVQPGKQSFPWQFVVDVTRSIVIDSCTLDIETRELEYEISWALHMNFMTYHEY